MNKRADNFIWVSNLCEIWPCAVIYYFDARALHLDQNSKICIEDIFLGSSLCEITWIVISIICVLTIGYVHKYESQDRKHAFWKTRLIIF